MGFKQSAIDECVSYHDSTIFFCYVDDSILIDPDPKNMDKVIQELQDLNYDISDEGKIDDYLGVKIERLPNGSIKMTEPHLIDQILEDLNLHHNGSKYKPKAVNTPAMHTIRLKCDVDAEPHKENWSYRSVIGKLNFLEKSSCPDLAYSVHNAARFPLDPKESHSQAVK